MQNKMAHWLSSILLVVFLPGVAQGALLDIVKDDFPDILVNLDWEYDITGSQGTFVANSEIGAGGGPGTAIRINVPDGQGMSPPCTDAGAADNCSIDDTGGFVGNPSFGEFNLSVTVDVNTGAVLSSMMSVVGDIPGLPAVMAGLLLQGTVSDFGFTENPGGGAFQFVFDLTGGSLNVPGLFGDSSQAALFVSAVNFPGGLAGLQNDTWDDGVLVEQGDIAPFSVSTVSLPNSLSLLLLAAFILRFRAREESQPQFA